jgi:dipeptidyl aminopeptidase/acylaminoacyl peptidase
MTPGPRRAAALCLAAWTAAGPAAASAAPFELTVDNIMRGPRLVGNPPEELRWSGDSRELFFEWKLGGEDEAATWVVSVDRPQPRRLGDDERRLAPATSGAWDAAGRRLAFVDAGDIVVVDTVARTRRQLTRTAAGEAHPRWARQDTAVTFTRDNSLYVLPVTAAGDGLVQVVDVGPAKPSPAPTDAQKFLRDEERALLRTVAEAADKKKRDEERKKKKAPPRFEITGKQRVADARLSPDDRHVFLLVVDEAEGARTADIPRYVTETAYTESTPARTNVGDAQERERLAIFDVQTGKPVWASGAFAGPAPEPSPAPSPSPSPSPAAPEPKYRETAWSMPIVSPDGRFAVASVTSFDLEDRWIVAVDPATGATRVLHHEHGDAWVRDLGTGSYDASNFGFLPDGRTVFFLSEHTGWMHLYTVPADGGPVRAVTSGEWEVNWADLDPGKRTFLITTTEAHPGERQLYTVPIGGGPRTRLTTTTGSNTGVLSPDERTLGLLHSASNRPPEVFLAPARPAGAPTQVTTSTTPEWRSYPWVDPQLVAFAARDGAMVPARLYTPEMVGKTRDPRKPAAIFIHGAGYLQNAHRYWSVYYREYMFHHLLADRGYVVLDLDYRGSAGYGRGWRTAIYRHMGGKDLEDVLDGAAWLASAHGVDPARIGVYGGSYGGFLTLMALFTSPRTFAAGAALRPVTDWAHYNHGYTAQILNEPPGDPEAYRRSSPIYFAEGLAAPLLICHGLVDDNVHAQDSIRLAQRLIELRKDDWELALYPVEKHAFEEETSWADEYHRILKLFETRVRGVEAPRRSPPAGR